MVQGCHKNLNKKKMNQIKKKKEKTDVHPENTGCFGSLSTFWVQDLGSIYLCMPSPVPGTW